MHLGLHPVHMTLAFLFILRRHLCGNNDNSNKSHCHRQGDDYRRDTKDCRRFAAVHRIAGAGWERTEGMHCVPCPFGCLLFVESTSRRKRIRSAFQVVATHSGGRSKEFVLSVFLARLLACLRDRSGLFIMCNDYCGTSL